LVAPLRHGGLTQKTGDSFVPDSFSHELYLQVEEENNKVLFSGCAHKGIENIMAWFSPNVFVGGMHLSHFPLDETLTTLAEKLKPYNAHYITGHCTGLEQFQVIKGKISKISYLSCGKALAI
jgi:7,8-dihydropterin-6-yl-methyl-4-(beta-D-ribofuranosyl)aminobenzene 5'-phosphate synthase